MKRMMGLFLIAIISLTSAFFVSGGKAEVEAACQLGHFYNTKSKACEKLKDTNSEKANVSAIGKAFEAFAYSVIYLSAGFALIMVIYAGMQYTMSEGDPFKIQEAKNILLRAGVGMLIAFSVYNILGLFDAFRGL